MLTWLRAAVFLFSVQRVKNLLLPEVCVNISCLTCDTKKPSKDIPSQPSDGCSLCSQMTDKEGAATIFCSPEIPKSCRKDFSVSQNASTSSLLVDESTNLSCNYMGPLEPTVFRWYKNGTLLQSTNTSQLSLNNVNQSFGGNYCCEYENVCGNYSSQCVQITVGRENNSAEMYVLILCGLAAVVFLALFTWGVKCALKRDIAKAQHEHKEQSPVTEVSTFRFQTEMLRQTETRRLE